MYPNKSHQIKSGPLRQPEAEVHSRVIGVVFFPLPLFREIPPPATGLA